MARMRWGLPAGAIGSRSAAPTPASTTTDLHDPLIHVRAPGDCRGHPAVDNLFTSSCPIEQPPRGNPDRLRSDPA
jgi:hypothetical protein